MTGWRDLSLNEVGRVARGRSTHRPRNDPSLYGGGIPFFQTGDVKAAGFWLRHFTQTYSERGLAQSNLWPVGTVCITIAANIAETAVLGVPAAFPDSVVGFVADADKADFRFVKYAIDTLRVRMQQVSHGTTQDNLSLDKLIRFKLRVPALDCQRRIADILYSYDDLIDNCERRIRVLEEMAHALYREWFVLFRYPGYEETPLVESAHGNIPKGWIATNLEGLVELDTGKRPKGGAVGADDAVPSVGAENVKGIGQHDYAAEKHIPREFFAGMRRGLVRDRDVGLYKDGAYIGRSTYFRDGFPHAEFAVNEHVFLLRPTSPHLGTNRLYLWLQQPETVLAIRSKNANAAQPGISQGIVNGLSIVIPPQTVTAQFETHVEPYLALIIALAKRAQALRKTRDLLLPRLLSGQLTVEHAA